MNKLVDKIDVLAFGAHPDDVELGIGGTLSKIVDNGKKVVIIDLTQGELSTRGNIVIRNQESDKASQILGIYDRINLKMCDGFFECSKKNILKIIYYIRKYNPEIIFTTPLGDRHPDHEKAHKLVKDACFFSGLSKIQTFQKGQLQIEWRPKKMYYYILWDILTPSFIVDVSGFEKKKIEACMAYKSQFFNKEANQKETLISSKNFQESILYRMKDLGRIIESDYGEGLITNKCISVKNIFHLV